MNFHTTSLYNDFRIFAKYKKLMQIALSEAKSSLLSFDVPIGALVADESGEVVAKAHNLRNGNNSPLAHAELLAIEEAGRKLETYHLEKCTLVTTLEPCIMCAGAILNSKIGRVVFGSWNEKSGAVSGKFDVFRDFEGVFQKTDVIGGVLEKETSAILKEFFEGRRG
ncbi:MAG: nucleoside deaminase [Holosporales bacterium]|jgi:tRNA(adenine34) deaminase|nr:nucleoside deaminase [Holosporales bacterium]